MARTSPPITPNYGPLRNNVRTIMNEPYTSTREATEPHYTQGLRPKWQAWLIVVCKIICAVSLVVIAVGGACGLIFWFDLWAWNNIHDFTFFGQHVPAAVAQVILVWFNMLLFAALTLIII